MALRSAQAEAQEYEHGYRMLSIRLVHGVRHAVSGEIRAQPGGDARDELKSRV